MSPAEPGRFVEMGRLVAPFGVQGWIKVEPYSADPAALLDHRSWWLADSDRGWREHRLVAARPHGALLVAKLEGIATREDAQARKGRAIAVPRDALPKAAEGEVYWIDLPGLSVFDRAGERLGTVTDVMDNGAHGILRVKGEDGREHLIPNVPAYVESIDLAERRIDVDWQRDY